MSNNWVPGSKRGSYFDGAGRRAGTSKVDFHTARTVEKGKGIPMQAHSTRPPPRRRIRTHTPLSIADWRSRW